MTHNILKYDAITHQTNKPWSTHKTKHTVMIRHICSTEHSAMYSSDNLSSYHPTLITDQMLSSGGQPWQTGRALLLSFCCCWAIDHCSADHMQTCVNHFTSIDLHRHSSRHCKWVSFVIGELTDRYRGLSIDCRRVRRSLLMNACHPVYMPL